MLPVILQSAITGLIHNHPSHTTLSLLNVTTAVPSLSSSSFPSQFAVMAKEDDDRGNNQKALICCCLLALQFGLQPMIASRFTAPTVSKESVVVATELSKIIIAAVFIFFEGFDSWKKTCLSWSLWDSLKVAALPATLYAIQNVLVQHGYQLLDSMTFNLLNQTKTLSAAFWAWVLLGSPQSTMQMFALLLLLAAALILNIDQMTMGSSSGLNIANADYQMGVLKVFGASMMSGLSAALTQRALSRGKAPRHPLFFSAELGVYGIAFLIGKEIKNGRVKPDELLSSMTVGWTWYTLIPVIVNALGGLVVGLVTKYAGGVVKGFALIAGILITGFAQYLVESKQLGPEHWVAVVLVSVSIYLHSKYPAKKSIPRIDSSDLLKQMQAPNASANASSSRPALPRIDSLDLLRQKQQ